MKQLLLVWLLCGCQCEVKLETRSQPSGSGSVPLKLQPVPNPVIPIVVKPAAVVAEHSLDVDGGAEAVHNIELAAQKLDGLVIPPGGQFSYNHQVGERTEANGFQVAKVLFEGVPTQDLGGGVCQVSTALYVALMKGGYQVTERHPHTRPRPYALPGMDSSINWPDLDLRLTNNDSQEVTIRAGLEGRRLTVKLESGKVPPKLKTRWVSSVEVPFEIRRVESKYAARVIRHRRGEPGTPGTRVWEYEGRILTVRSEYRPITEVLVVPATEP